MSAQFWNIISCSLCAAPESIENLSSLSCQNCNSTFFLLGDILCLFPSGTHQRDSWNHLFAVFKDNGEEAGAFLSEQLTQPGLSPLTVERLQNTRSVHDLTQANMVDFLQSSGLRPVKNTEYEQYSMNLFLNNYGLILRDWGWSSSVAWQADAESVDENRIALDNILRIMEPALSGGYQPCRVLFIGAGAGRLSWDLHCSLTPEMTVAMDFNPMLMSLASRVIKNKDPLHWYEKNQTDENGEVDFYQWPLNCPTGSEHLRHTWFPLLADAWAMPFSAQSFDLVITPWFIDVMKRDCKELIALVEKLLVPGGYWLNYGPFLYSDDFKESCKYNSTELKDFLQLSQFSIINEQFFQVPYVCSPLTGSGRVERVWGVLARSASSRVHLDDAGAYDGFIDRDFLPAWMIMPHLPIPRLTKPELFPPELENITRLTDGKKSINDLKSHVAPYLPERYDAGDVIYQLFLYYAFNPES
jgi:predicted RNA methylase